MLVVKNQPTNAGDARDSGSIPGLGRSPGVGDSNPPQYPYLENSMNRGAWPTTVYRVTKSQTQLSSCVHICLFIGCTRSSLSHVGYLVADVGSSSLTGINLGP